MRALGYSLRDNANEPFDFLYFFFYSLFKTNADILSHEVKTSQCKATQANSESSVSQNATSSWWTDIITLSENNF